MATENDNLKSRESFAESLVDVIKGECGQNEHAYIIGLSGSWGSGKTYILDRVEKILTSSGDTKYAVVKVDAWKYADQPTFLKALLLGLNKKVSRSGENDRVDSLRGSVSQSKVRTTFLSALWLDLKRTISSSNGDDSIEDLTRSTSQTKIKPIAFLIYLAVIVLIPVVVWWLRNIININTDLIYYLQHVFELEGPFIIPAVIIAGLQYYGVFNVTTPAVKTLDQSEKVFDDLLSKHKGSNSRVVIIIDNLDRLLPESALNILSVLRTFADKKGVVYLVAADSSVLSRGIGNQMMDGDDNSDQYGSNYLRKTFDLYWPLPDLTDEELAIFVKKKVSVKFFSTVLAKTDADEAVKLIVSFGNRNLRVIERIIERFHFELYIIHKYIEDKSMSGEQLKALRSLSDHPLLLLKTQILHEFWPYLYASLKHRRYSELLDLEKLSYEGIGPFKLKLVEYFNESQYQYEVSVDAPGLKQFLSGGHPFFRGRVPTIYNLGVLTALSVESIPNDDRTMTTQTFISELVDGEADTVRNAVLQYSPEGLKAQSSDIAKSLNDLQIETFASGFGNLLKALAIAELNDINQYQPLINVANTLQRWSELKEQSSGIKHGVRWAIAAFLTSPAGQYSSQASELEDFIQYPGADETDTSNARTDLNNLKAINDVNAWGILQLSLSWVLRADLVSETYDTLEHLYKLANSVKDHYRFKFLKPSVEVTQEISQKWNGMEPKNRALVVAYLDLFNLTEPLNSLWSIDSSVFDRNDHSEIGKVLVTISELKPYGISFQWISKQDIEDQLIAHINAATNLRAAFEYGIPMLNSFSELRTDKVWEAMIEFQGNFLDQVIADPSILDLVTGPDIAPSETIGSQLFTSLMQYLKSKDDKDRSDCELIKRLKKDRPIWSNVKINRTIIIKKCSDVCTQDLLDLRTSWGLS